MSDPVRPDQNLEQRVAKLIGDACDDAIECGVLGDAECAVEVFALVREQVACELEAMPPEYFWGDGRSIAAQAVRGIS